MSYDILQQVSEGLELTGDVKRDVTEFLTLHGFHKTVRHSAQVASEARKIARQYAENEQVAVQSAWLHDISAIFPNAERIAVAEALDIIPLPEERRFPLIIHQRLSEVMARDIFGVTDSAVLSAVGCHTTLKKDASNLDKVLFVADKVRWDQEGEPPYLTDIRAGLEVSLNAATVVYLDYLWKRRDTLAVIHPWLEEAYQQLA